MDCENQTSILYGAFSNTSPFLLLQANHQACQGKYAPSGASAAGGESLFVANHAY